MSGKYTFYKMKHEISWNLSIAYRKPGGKRYYWLGDDGTDSISIKGQGITEIKEVTIEEALTWLGEGIPFPETVKKLKDIIKKEFYKELLDD